MPGCEITGQKYFGFATADTIYRAPTSGDFVKRYMIPRRAAQLSSHGSNTHRNIEEQIA
jgi:hypothetical protein